MSIIATVIGIITLLIKRLTINKISPKYNYLIYIVFMIVLIFPVSIPSKISIYNYIDISNIKDFENKHAEEILHVYNESEKDKNEMSQQIRLNHSDNIITQNIEKIIIYLWFGIATFKILRIIVSNIMINKAVGKNEVKNERINTILERCKKRLKIKKNIKIIKQNFIKSPSTIGVLNVRILITDNFLELDNVAITNVIMHELSHYKRKDNVVNILMMFIKAIHWFNPVIKVVFEQMKVEMEIATDEMAIKRMNTKEKSKYCMTMLKVICLNNCKLKELLGMAADAEEIKTRIDMIVLKEKFEKYSKLITISTMSIILLMCLLFYPSSYGKNEIPKLYLKLENGDIKEIPQLTGKHKTIQVEANSPINIIVNDAKCENYIIYKKLDLDSKEKTERYINVSEEETLYLDIGNYLYKFQLIYLNNKIIEYEAKIIVE